MSDWDERVAAEIEGLHQFFEDWGAGRMTRSQTNFARFSGVTAPDFHLVSPSGTMVDYAQVEAWIWEMHNTRPDWRLWVEAVQVTAQRAGLWIVTYEEWQESPAGRTVRFSSALLEAASATPNGLRWLHVHETWLPTPA